MAFAQKSHAGRRERFEGSLQPEWEFVSREEIYSLSDHPTEGLEAGLHLQGQGLLNSACHLPSNLMLGP